VQPAYSVMFGEDEPRLAGGAEPTRTAGLDAASAQSEVKRLSSR